MHVYLAESARIFLPSTDYFNFSRSPSSSPDVETPATPDHPLLAERPLVWLDVEHSMVRTMDIGNVLNLQTQAAHGLARPQAKPVQKTAISRKPASPSAGSKSSSSSSSSSSSPSPSAGTRCTRCRRTISLDESDSNAVSFGSHIYYCGSCTRLLESRG